MEIKLVYRRELEDILAKEYGHNCMMLGKDSKFGDCVIRVDINVRKHNHETFIYDEEDLFEKVIDEASVSPDYYKIYTILDNNRNLVINTFNELEMFKMQMKQAVRSKFILK